MAAGLEPDSFWRQSPRSFVTIMEGRGRAAKREQDLAILQAWHTEAFARAKRLKKLSDYIGEKQQGKAQSPDAMLAAFRAFNGKGGKMNIRQVN